MPKNFECKICRARFSKNQQLRAHLARKNPCNPILEEKDLPEAKKGRKYKCGFCGRAFNSDSNMNQHVRKFCKIFPRNGDPAGMALLREHIAKQADEKNKTELEALRIEMQELRQILQWARQAQNGPDPIPLYLDAAAGAEQEPSPALADENEPVLNPKPENGAGRRKQLPAALRNAVWNVYIGPKVGEALCFCCRAQPILRSNYECGHIRSRARGGSDKLGNLRPICGLCNKSMGTRDMLEFASECGFASCEAEPARASQQEHAALTLSEQNRRRQLEMSDELREDLYPE